MRKSAMITGARERAEEAAWRLRQAEMRQRAAEFGATLQARRADLGAKAQAGIGKAQPKLEGLSERAQAKGQELAARAQAKVEEVQPKVEELAAKAQEKGAELATMAQVRGGELADEGFRRLGARLSRGRAAERLRIQPASRTFPWWLAGLLGVGVGYGIAMLVGVKRAATSSEARPLVDSIWQEITNDPRTSSLPDLRVDVADGTVFVRGAVLQDFDEQVLLEIIEGVPGVRDVDLQVSGR